MIPILVPFSLGQLSFVLFHQQIVFLQPPLLLSVPHLSRKTLHLFHLKKKKKKKRHEHKLQNIGNIQIQTKL